MISNRLNYLFIFILYLVLLMGCRSKKCPDIKEVKIKNEATTEVIQLVDQCNDRVISKQEFKKISKDSIIAEGFYKEYYPNGNLKVWGFYKENIQDSIGFQYYPTKELQATSFKSEGQFYGPQYVYYQNGKIKTVTFHKNDSMTWFQVNYKNDGVIDHIEGKSIRIMAKPGFEQSQIGKSFGLINEVPYLPGTKTTLHIQLLKDNTNILDTVITNFITVLNTKIYPFKKVFNSSGNYDYIATVELTDSMNKNLIKKDSVRLVIGVK